MTVRSAILAGVTGQPTQLSVKEGDVLANKYRVERVLGEGAMGVVVAAMHVHLGERVALKFLKPDLANNQEVVARFLREAQSAVRIKGEHVARVSDVGTLDTGAPYMVMEYLVGSDLGVLLEKHKRLEIAHAVDFVIQACAALAEAHALGIVHRDLKPANLFLTTRPDGSALVKVLDFGVAKLLNNDPSKPQLTANGAVIGSPVYMSPEQLLGKKTVDARSDVWQLGVILHELLSGDCPFDGNSMADIMLAIGVRPAKPLRQVRADVPAELESLVLQCLEKDVARRIPDVAALAEGLLPFATTRRAQVSVEHIVALLRGAQAVASLPAMRAKLQSGAMLMDSMSERPGIPTGTAEGSNPYAQTMASVGAPEIAAARASVPGPAPIVRNERLVQTSAAVNAQPRKQPSTVVPWIFAGVMGLVGLFLVAYALGSRAHAPSPAQSPAPTVAPRK